MTENSSEETSPTFPFDIERLIFETAAEYDVPFARKVLVFLNKRTHIWLDPIIYRHVILLDRKPKQVDAFIDALSSKPPSFQETAIQTLVLPSLMTPKDLFKLLTMCKNIRNLVFPRSLPLFVAQLPFLRGVIAKQPLEVFHALVNHHRNPSWVVPVDVFSKLRILIIIGQPEEWRLWDWEKIVHDPRGRLEFIGICANRGAAEFFQGCPFEFIRPSEDGTVVGDVPSDSFGYNYSSSGDTYKNTGRPQIRIRICCVRLDEPSELYSTDDLVMRGRHYGDHEWWFKMMGLTMGGSRISEHHVEDEGATARSTEGTGVLYGYVGQRE